MDQDKPSIIKGKKAGKSPRWIRLVFLLLFFSFIAAQFFQPQKNNNDLLAKNDITSLIFIPDTVQQLLKIACYDCHSNNTRYPWYTDIQPVGWWMKDHVDEGKKQLNFNEFANLAALNGKKPLELQLKKLEAIKKQIEKDEMPLSSYLIIHKNAKFDEAKKRLILNWLDSASLQLEHLP